MLEVFGLLEADVVALVLQQQLLLQMYFTNEEESHGLNTRKRMAWRVPAASDIGT